MFLFLDVVCSLLETSDFVSCLHLLYLLTCVRSDSPAGFQALRRSVRMDSPLGRACVLAQNDFMVFLCCCQDLALAVYDLLYGLMSRYNRELSFENFSGLQSGSSYQICSLPWPVQHLPHQAVLYFQHSHYSSVRTGVKLVCHLPDAFCSFQWQLTG